MFQFHSPKILSRNLLNYESYRPFGGPVSSARVSVGPLRPSRSAAAEPVRFEACFSCVCVSIPY